MNIKSSEPNELTVARPIREKTFAEQWAAMDAELPDAQLSEEEILSELMDVRYQKSKSK